MFAFAILWLTAPLTGGVSCTKSILLDFQCVFAKVLTLENWADGVARHVLSKMPGMVRTDRRDAFLVCQGMLGLLTLFQW